MFTGCRLTNGSSPKVSGENLWIGEYTAYEHLRHGGVLVAVGEKVGQGQLIGSSGMTGYGFLPHLHFEVFTNPDTEESEGETLEVNFQKNQFRA